MLMISSKRPVIKLNHFLHYVIFFMLVSGAKTCAVEYCRPGVVGRSVPERPGPLFSCSLHLGTDVNGHDVYVCIKLLCVHLTLTVTLIFFSCTWHILTQYQGSHFTGGCQSTFSDLSLWACEMLLKRRPWCVQFSWKHFQNCLAFTSSL